MSSQPFTQKAPLFISKEKSLLFSTVSPKFFAWYVLRQGQAKGLREGEKGRKTAEGTDNAGNSQCG